MDTMTTGSGIFYDGVTSARHEVAVDLGSDDVRISAAQGEMLARWRLADIAALATPQGVLRIGPGRGKADARLEIHDAALAAALLLRTGRYDSTGLTDRRTRIKVVAWSLAAIVTLIGGAIWGVPLLADRTAPYMPVALEMRLGDAIDTQVRQALGASRGTRPFECGTGDSPAAASARAAFTQLVASLEAVAGLPLPLHVSVVHNNQVNAITIPGGRIYVFEGLLAKADSVDEVAGVIGHEMGHVAHRDGTKSVLEGASLSLLFGMLLGDFTGGSGVVIAARTVLRSSYSREAEAAADDFGANLVAKAGGNPHALGAFLVRIAGKQISGPHLLLDHPEAAQRAVAIDRIAKPSPLKALLTPAQWSALKTICAG
jgi:Zn-dependent protease with chaperone function